MTATKEEIKKDLDKLVYDVMGEYEEFISGEMREEIINQVLASISRHKKYNIYDLKRSFRSVLANRLKD